MLIVIIVCCGFLYARSQQQLPSITADFNATPLHEFADKIEQLSGHRFFYNLSEVDSLKINISARQLTLDKLLKLAFSNTGFYFSIDHNKNIFLTRGVQIRTTLPAGFYGRKTEDDSLFHHVGYADTDLFDSTDNYTGTTLENKLYEIGDRNNADKPGNATIAGFVKDDKTGEPLPGVSIFLEGNENAGVATDQHGFYSLTLPRGRHVLQVQSRGKQDTRRQIMLHSDGKLNIDLHDHIVALRGVIVSSRKSANVTGVQLGVERLNIKTIKEVPVVFGEADLLKVMLTLPGVKSVGEASTGYHVRGGASDQNLIQFNGTTIYNPSHFFGFFSAFNAEVVKDVQLYKSSIPAKYGGRLSSVLDVTSREGNKKKMAGAAGIGLVTSRINLEGPLSGDSSSSFLVGARATYASWLLKLLPDEYEKSKAGFYDVTLHTTHELDRKNNMYITAYLSNDRFNLNNDTTYGYGNRNISLQWKHTFNNKLVAVTTAGYDGYAYNISSKENAVNAYALHFRITQSKLKSDFTWFLNPRHTIEFGGGTILYKLHPGSYRPVGKTSLVETDIVAAEQAHETAVYASDRFNLNRKISVEYGIRYSVYQFLGAQEMNEYAPGLPREETNRTGIKKYNSGEAIKTYHGAEYRVALRYAFTPDFSVKAGYNSLRQYIHMLSNTTAIAPTDIWKLSDMHIRPQLGDQVSLGLFHNFYSNAVETSLEVYYKRMKNLLDYKSGAVLVLNHDIETDVFNASGKAYGVELMVRKSAGKLNGWVGYSYSRTLLKMDDPIAGEIINDGKYYPGNYDKPHDMTLVMNYRLSHRFSVSSTITYSTGRPITMPVARFVYGGSQRILYSERNSFRIPDLFRTDLSMNIDGNHKVNQRAHNSWTIGLYNVTGRKNPYSVYFTSEGGRLHGYKLSIFGSVIPYINYNIRF